MAVSTGKKKYSVKVLNVNTEDLEKEFNNWLDALGKCHEIIDIELSSSQTKSVVLILYRELN